MGEHTPVSQSRLADLCGVSASTISWRVKAATKAGWIKNLETREGHPAKLVRGEPLPVPSSTMPTIEDVRAIFESAESHLTLAAMGGCGEVFECSNDFGERVEGDLDNDE
jgi:hypothetical protein